MPRGMILTKTKRQVTLKLVFWPPKRNLLMLRLQCVLCASVCIMCSWGPQKFCLATFLKLSLLLLLLLLAQIPSCQECRSCSHFRLNFSSIKYAFAPKHTHWSPFQSEFCHESGSTIRICDRKMCPKSEWNLEKILLKRQNNTFRLVVVAAGDSSSALYIFSTNI